jgi:hypothetical protein
VGNVPPKHRPERAVQNGLAILILALSGRSLLALTHRVAVGCYAMPFQGGGSLLTKRVIFNRAKYIRRTNNEIKKDKILF